MHRGSYISNTQVRLLSSYRVSIGRIPFIKVIPTTISPSRSLHRVLAAKHKRPPKRFRLKVSTQVRSPRRLSRNSIIRRREHITLFGIRRPGTHRSRHINSPLNHEPYQYYPQVRLEAYTHHLRRDHCTYTIISHIRRRTLHNHYSSILLDGHDPSHRQGLMSIPTLTIRFRTRSRIVRPIRTVPQRSTQVRRIITFTNMPPTSK